MMTEAPLVLAYRRPIFLWLKRGLLPLLYMLQPGLSLVHSNELKRVFNHCSYPSQLSLIFSNALMYSGSSSIVRKKSI